jgi:surface antigen
MPGGGNPNQWWQQQYGQNYTYRDDSFYTQCRQTTDPAGVLAGALIGGLLGNVAGNGRGTATIAGVIVGGAAGAALTQSMSCDDRSYAYRTYYDGLNSGTPNRRYDWRNQNTGTYGFFNVGDYYDDPYGFRCATYSQQVFVQGRLETATGRACRQPDGTWAIVSN